MNKRMKEFCAAMVVIVLAFAAFFMWEASWQTPDDVRHYDEEPYYLVTATPTETPTASPTKVPTASPTRTQEPSNAPSTTNSPLPTITSLFEDFTTSYGTPGRRKAEVNGTHGWKPLAWYTAVNDRTMPQWRLQQIAKTDERGLRIVKDPNGEWRYCVALPVYWAGGSSDDIGRCVDIIMANGATLKCVLGDTKRVWKSVNGEGKYGVGHNELIEVQCDLSKMNPIVPQMGDASYIGPEWEGDVAEVIALDLFIDGFGKE